eukprot:TRINITY_DN30366_c0_g1_i3.p1 TRINITY_DN30366_c0_g1~~TRINITY_DN30366_c0_g1_i3.p1  ORF type:complete len:315 (-),score=72.53 TRINITY_DN30366_c0_g1_i3:8-829(-)
MRDDDRPPQLPQAARSCPRRQAAATGRRLTPAVRSARSGGGARSARLRRCALTPLLLLLPLPLLPASSAQGPIDCFTHAGHFNFCCCEEGGDECWANPNGLTFQMCCDHLVHLCPGREEATAVEAAEVAASSPSSTSAAATAAESGATAAAAARAAAAAEAEASFAAAVAAGVAGIESSPRRPAAAAAAAAAASPLAPPTAAAALDFGGSRPRPPRLEATAEAVDRQEGREQAARRCWDFQVYSRDHCCDTRFRPPASRCFDTVGDFEVCCSL